MVYCAILFYQVYRSHTKSNGKSVAFLEKRDYCPKLLLLELGQLQQAFFGQFFDFNLIGI